MAELEQAGIGHQGRHSSRPLGLCLDLVTKEGSSSELQDWINVVKNHHLSEKIIQA